jgi:hypothetical protein
MGDTTPDRFPEPEPKRSGGPPKPPKKTSKGLADNSPGDGRAFQFYLELVEFTIYFLESPLAAQPESLSILEEQLDSCVVALGGFFKRLDSDDQDRATRHLRKVRDYWEHNLRSGSGDQKLRERAQKILDELPK